MLSEKADGKLLNMEFELMTASQQAKAAGLKSLAQVSELTGVSFQTLNNWAKHKPQLFEAVLLGCLALTDR